MEQAKDQEQCCFRPLQKALRSGGQALPLLQLSNSKVQHMPGADKDFYSEVVLEPRDKKEDVEVAKALYEAE